MTRDEFAAWAMQSLILRHNYILVLDDKGVETIALKAYRIADAMMKRSMTSQDMEAIVKKEVDSFVSHNELYPKKPSQPSAPPVSFAADSGKKESDPLKHWQYWTDKELEKLLRLHRNGVSNENIARALGRKRKSITVALWRVKNGLPIGKKQKVAKDKKP